MVGDFLLKWVGFDATFVRKVSQVRDGISRSKKKKDVPPQNSQEPEGQAPACPMRYSVSSSCSKQELVLVTVEMYVSHSLNKALNTKLFGVILPKSVFLFLFFCKKK